MMSQNTKELMLEILEVDNTESSPLKREPEVSQVEGTQDARSYLRSPSPAVGELVMSAVELGWGEGKEFDQLSGVVVGRLKDVNDLGQPLVDFPGNPFCDSVQARSTVHVGKADLVQDVVLMFEQGDLRKPIIMGILHSSDDEPPLRGKNEESEQMQPTEVELDGERLTFTAKKEIVLKCGKASITLTKAGKILIKGEYLLNRASGVNRIQGGSVQIN